MDSCGEIALTPSATHGAVDEVKRDEDEMGGGENKHLWTVSSDHEHSPTQGLAWARPRWRRTAYGRWPPVGPWPGVLGARVRRVFACVVLS